MRTSKAFAPGFFDRVEFAESLKDEDPAKALLVWMRTAVDSFLGDSGGPRNAVEGWEVFSDWIKRHRERQNLDLTRPADQVLRRIGIHADLRLLENDRSRSVTDLRVVEPWIDAFFVSG